MRKRRPSRLARQAHQKPAGSARLAGAAGGRRKPAGRTCPTAPSDGRPSGRPGFARRPDRLSDPVHRLLRHASAIGIAFAVKRKYSFPGGRGLLSSGTASAARPTSWIGRGSFFACLGICVIGGPAPAPGRPETARVAGSPRQPGPIPEGSGEVAPGVQGVGWSGPSSPACVSPGSARTAGSPGFSRSGLRPGRRWRGYSAR